MTPHYIDERTGKPKIILQLCADTGSDTKPYADVGYDRRLVGSKIGVENYEPPEFVYGIIANPVCTEFSIAKGFHKECDYEKGMFLVRHCQRIIKQANPAFWVIENPYSGRLKLKLGLPQYVYEPWEFGSPWTKKTALWGRFNLFRKTYYWWKDVPQNPNLYIRPGRKKPSIAFLHKNAKQFIKEFDCFEVNTDMEFRSLCSQNFAQAFYYANP
jgi:hypothetical protein